MKTYAINEWFYSLQGEGVRAGTANLFLRFAGCNLKCDTDPGPLSPGGFKCDTEFMSGRKLTAEEIVKELKEAGGACDWVILTGGEPCLQVDDELVAALHGVGYKVGIETNGSLEVQPFIDWITVSPKVAEHAIVQLKANEVKYVRHYGQGIPKTRVEAAHYLISPGFDGGDLNQKNLEWCIRLVKENPKWRLSVQQHKSWSIR